MSAPSARGWTRPAGRSVLVTITWALLCLALAQTPDNYYPASDGLSWTYSSGETQQLSGPRDQAGRSVMVLTHYFEGVPVSEDYLLYDEGVHSVGTAAAGSVMAYDPPLMVYAPGPLQPGNSWKSTTQLPDFSITLSSEVLGMRGVKTPVGRFNALQIRQHTLTSNGAQTMMDIYFVPGIGVVRFVTQDGTTIDLIDKNF